jgi:Flp pilus assembly protein TadG
MFHPLRSDSERVSVSERTPAARRPDRESGQAMVEFALIAFPLLTLVAGIIWFGIGLNYWLDMQRVANQGARWAAVNNWPPECSRTDDTCTNTPACDAATRTQVTLSNTLRCQAITKGLQSSVCVTISYPDVVGTAEAGDPVQVQLESSFSFVPILGLGTISLVADATMRLEQDPTKVTATTCP